MSEIEGIKTNKQTKSLIKYEPRNNLQTSMNHS